MNLIDAFQASTHRAAEMRHILVRLESREGAVGWGECSTLREPYYVEETTQTAWHVLHDFIGPRVAGRTFSSVEALVDSYATIKGNAFARASMEIAAWDLWGRTEGRSVSSLLGGTRREILSGVSLGMEPDSARLLDRIAKYLEEGYRRVKLKVGPGHDVAMLEAVRKRFPDTPLMVDANSSYSLSDAEHLKRLDAFGLMMIEEPLAGEDLFDHAMLQERLDTPICLDESIRSARQAAHAIRLGSCRVINIKVPRVGGFFEARRIHDECLAHGIPAWCGGMHDFGVGRAANIAIASLPGFSLPGDTCGSNKYYSEDIVDPPIVAEGGAIAVPSSPGLGFECALDRIKRHTLRHIDIEPGKTS